MHGEEDSEPEPTDDADDKVGDSLDENNWIQKAVNPKHKGYCSPMSKSTCTPERKALAKRFKHHLKEIQTECQSFLTKK
jgi:hypothetical protein